MTSEPAAPKLGLEMFSSTTRMALAPSAWLKRHRASSSAVMRAGTSIALMVRGLSHRITLSQNPALSFVPECRAPPNGRRATIPPVGCR